MSIYLASCGAKISPYSAGGVRYPHAEVKTDKSKSVHPDLLADNKPTNEEEEDFSKTGTIGSVLIATVAFAAAFTVPGGCRRG